jgi:hypothetical protein
MRRAIVALFAILIFLVPVVGEPLNSELSHGSVESPSSTDVHSLSDWEGTDAGTGLPLPGTIYGSKSTSATSVIDSTHAAYFGTSAPLGWSSEDLEAQIEHLSQWVDAGLVNPNLDAYHQEHWFMSANPEYNDDPFYVPDGWTFVKNDAIPSGTQHPQHGYFEINGYSGAGYDATWGWRFDGNLDSGATVNPTNGFYMSQQVSTQWRSIYTAEITFCYYVSSTSTLNDEVYIFTSLEGYTSKYHVFDAGTTMDTWHQASATVPSTFFESMQDLDSLLFNIGLGTDIDGHPSTADHEVYIDEIALSLNVRPFPEDINLQANGAIVTGSTKGSVSPYVPDSANRDCFSSPAGGVDLNGYGNDGALEVGADVPSYPDWSDAYSYQVGLQFPLNVPQGAAIESAFLEVEAVEGSVGYPGMRIYVADEDNVAAFTTGNPALPDRYSWINTSVYWRPTTWSANGRYQTPDLAGLIQELVSRSGWQSGNYICVMIGYAYSNQQYTYSAVKGSSNYLQGDLARLFVDFIEPASEDTIPSFKFSKTITVDHTRVASDLQDFPVLVDIWDKDLHLNTQPDGDDIAFLYNGQVIPHELELYDKKGNGTHAHLTCWVSVPYLSSAEDTMLVMVYGDDAIGSQENPSAVWDSDFSAVWHLSDNPAQPQWQSTYADYLPHQPQIQDSSLNGLDGSTYGTMTTSDSVSGQIGNAIDLDGANDYVDFGNPQELQMTGSFTVEAWFKADFIDNDYLVVKSGESNYRGWDLSFDDDASISPAGWVMFRYSPDGVNTNIVGYERVDTGQWYHVVGVFCPSFYARFYLNGELVGEETTAIPASMNSPSRPVRIGRRSDDPGGTSYMDAIVDEVRISSVVRSDAWIKTEYNNQRNPNLFLTVGEGIANFRYKKDITVDHTKVASNLTSFPVLIDMYDSDLKTNVQADGDDIMFASNGRNLPYEIELFDQQYNSTHAHLIAWVKADLSSITDTILTMYYSNPSIGAQENPSEVWGANYVGVWHLSESSGSAIDSTYFGKSGSVSAGVTRDQAGIAGTCYEFNGVNGNVDFGDPSDSHLDFGINAFSYSLWVRIDQSTSNYQLPLFKGGTTTSDAGYELETNTGGTDLKAEVSDGATQVISGSTTVTFGQWMYLVVIVDVSAGLLRFYRNGAQVGTPQSISSLGDISNSESFQISPLSYPLNGAVDEVRLRSEALSTGWLLTEYNNQLDPSSFYSLGIEQEVVVPKEVPLDFMYKKDITIDHTKVTSDLSGFPVLIELYDTDLRFDVQADGDDIVFVQDGWVLPYEIEQFDQSYDSSHAHLIAWVRLDLSASTDTVLSMYYGNPSSESLENPQGVWDTSFAAVWHLNEDPAGTVYDSTANNNDGISLSISSGPTLQQGKIDSCTEFYGETTKDRIEAPHSSSLALQSNILVEAWIRTTNADGTSDAIVAKWGDVGHRNYWLGKLDGSTLAFYVDNTQSVTASLSLVNDGDWHHVVGVANAMSEDLLLYVDGVERGSASYSGSTQTGTSVIQIANNPGSTGFIQEWDGRIDEVRVSSSYRSLGWIQTEYNNQNDPASFFSVGSEIGSVPVDFSFKKDITIDHTKVSGNLNDFPLLIDIFDADLKTKVQPDGNDILFKSGVTTLPHEIEVFDQSYNGTHAHLVAWVKTDLSSSVDAVITMYYGSPTAGSQENAAGVWDSNYKGVWHLSEVPTGAFYDSSSNSNDGTGYNLQSDDQVDGQIDGSIDFDSVQDYIDCGNDTSLNVGANDFSLSLWFKYDGVNTGVLAGKGAVLMAKRYRISIESGPGMLLAAIDDNTVAKNIYSTSTYGDNLWHYVSMVRDGNYLRLYIDGAEDANSPLDITGYGSIDEIESFYINAFRSEVGGTIGYYSSANTDEVRVAKMALSPDWIATEYTNQNNTAGFYIIGPETTPQVEYQPDVNAAEFKYRKNLVVDHTQVGEDLTDFPMLVDFYDVDLRTDVQADGDDIMFMSGNYWCPHEITSFDQTYNETHAHLTAWVKTDLSASVNTIITMYYGNPDLTSQECPSAVWGDYVGVWHLDESPTGTVYDSSQYNNDGITLGSMTGLDLVSGQIGSGFELDGVDDMISVSESSSLDSVKYAGTLSIWVNWADSSDGGYQRILTTTDRFDPPNYQVDGFEWAVQPDGDLYFYPWGGGSGDYNLATNPFTNSIWQYVVVTLDYSTKSVQLYLDGELLSLTIEQVPSAWTQLASLDDWLWGGNDVITDSQILGTFDEIRASNTIRSLGWILTEYNNQYSPNLFYSIESEEQISDNEIVFTTSSESSVTIGAQLSLRVQTSTYTYAEDFTQGTSFSIVNDSLPIWTAGVLVSPPSGVDTVSFEISYPEGEWWPFSVKSPSGIEIAYSIDWTCFDGRLIVNPSAIDEFGMWQIQFWDRNHVLDTKMGPAGGPYATTDQFSIGEDIQFRVWSSGTIGSTISLELTDPSGSAWYTGSTTFQGERFTLPYYHRKYLTISHDNVAEDLVDFPVLVEIYDTDLRTDVRSDGRDIAFAIGERTLSHEIETFDQTYNLTHAHLVAWVNVPLLSGSIDTIIAMYYGNPLAPIVYDSGPVWDSGYLGVWHLSESGTGALDEYQDSSQYKNDGQGGDGNSSYVPTQVAGKIGSGQDFNNLDGHYDFIDCGDSPLWQIDGYQITLEAWIQHDITPNTHVYGIMNHKGWYDGYALYINYGGGSTIKPTFALTAQDGYQLVGANDVTGGTWHHITATYDGSLMRIYVDGVQDPNVLVKTDAIKPSSYEKDFWIGHGDQPQDKAWSAEWVGQIDEVRVSDVVRSAGWIQTQFDNQYAPSSFYSIGGEESIGYSESASINLDSSVPAGVWHVTARYSDTSSDVNYRVGMLGRSFIVKRGVSLTLTAPGDAISDGISSKLVGEQLYVEYKLADSLTTALVSGATVTMNWTVGGAPTNVQLNDYGDGRYGKTLNTSDLGDYGRWRIDIDTEHPFYTDTSAFFYLDLSHRTFITYEPPEDSPYGDDFTVLLTFRDEFDGALLPGATIACNGTMTGAPVDYGNGTYLITIDSTGLSTGSYTFSFSATPSTSYLQSSQIDVQFTYRPIATDAYLIGSDTTTTPWNQQAVVTVHWSDIDHSGIGIDGGSISINPFVQTIKLDIGGGYYNLTIDVSSYSPGTYIFDLTISKTNYKQTTVTLTLIVDAHRTSIDVDYESVILIGTDCPLNLSFIDIDLSASPIGSGNLSRIIVDWGSGSHEFYSFTFTLGTSGWAIGSHTLNLTVVATSTPRYYMDTYIIINLEIRKLNVFLSWDHLEPFPNGNDFVMYLHVNVSEPGRPIDGASIDWLDQSCFSATNQTGGSYSFKSFLNLGEGLYELTIDSAIFFEGEYRIIVYVDFLLSENYTDTRTPTITFTYRPILTYLTSPDYPTVTTSYDTNVTVTLSYVDIDHSLNISTGIITGQGASIVWQYLADGVYEVQIIVQSWDLGVHEVNLTADATGYQAKTITLQILVQIAYAYARASQSTIDLPVGDSAVFYADYWDITHDEPILGATVAHDWSHSLTVSWTGTQYRIELPSLDTDTLGTYLVVFNFSKGSNYQFGYFNLTVVLRTHSTEFRLASAVEPTSHNAMVNVSVYCGDLDNDAGIVSPFVSLSVYNETGLIPSIFVNDTALGSGYFIIRLAASNLGISGVYELVIHFNWTGSIQKYYNRTVRAFVNVVGEASELDLLESSGPTPYLENMSYIYLYSELYSGIGISNSTPPVGNVFIYIQFPGESIDFSQVSIFEVVGYPGQYAIEFNSTIFGKPGIYTMLVFVNWSKSVDPFYGNRTDTVTVRITPRSSVITVIPPESTPYGVNATFTFSFDDVVDVTPARIANGSQMHVTIGLPGCTLFYNTSTRQFHVSFNTSLLGPPIGNRQFTMSISWTGAPFYANVTGRTIIINIRFRDTEFDCTSINPTPYGNNITLTMTFDDVTQESSNPINDGLITLLNGSQIIPAVNYQLSSLGNGIYELQLNTTYFGRLGTYQLKLEITTSHFYYAVATASRTLSLRYRLTTLVIEPVGETAYNSSLNVVFQYTDVLNYVQIGNGSTPTSIQILNGSSWLFSSNWRGISEDYLLVIETYNQALEINREYILWLRISYPDVSPYYREAEAYVSFILRERTTFIDLAKAPTPAPYLDFVNLTVFYGDLESSGGIAGAVITLSLYGSDLVEGDDYLLQSTMDGFYLISINTTSIGPAETSASLTLIASWTVGTPYYTDSSITLTLSVTQRGASAETLTSPAHVMFLENISFTFRYIDEATEELIQLNKNQVSIYSGGSPLQSSYFSMVFTGSGYEISINSTMLGTGLVTNWNITVYVFWQDTMAPYYTDDRVSVWVTTINRVGMLIRDPVPTTPIGDNMSLSFTYVDSSSGQDISDAIVVFDCLSPSGLVENTHFWVLRNGGHYTILVDTAYLGSIGAFSFSLRLLWSPSLIPYYANSTTILLQGSVRQIQASLESDEPDPSTVPINDNVSVLLTYSDEDHGVPITGAELAFSVTYKTNTSGPAIWSITPEGSGNYRLVVDCSDAGAIGTNTLIIAISFLDYQTTEIQVPFQIRERQGELNELQPVNPYYGEKTSVDVQLTDSDADDAPIDSALLSLSWSGVDSPTWISLGNGWYRINLTTNGLESGLYTLLIGAQKTNYFIPDISVPIQVLRIETEIIVPTTLPDVYWGDDISFWAIFNDTHHGVVISGAAVSYRLGILSGLMSDSLSPGNYSITVDTGSLAQATSYIITITATFDNYETATKQVTVNVLRIPLGLDIIGPLHPEKFKGELLNVTVYVNDTLHDVPLLGATVEVSWSQETHFMILSPVAGMNGYYSGFINTNDLFVGDYVIAIVASRNNYITASTSLTLKINQIPTTLDLDALTSTYSSQTFNWSETIRIGVYILVPSLNATGLSNCTVTWSLSGTTYTGQFQNGTVIGGVGYFYFDFDTWDYEATTYTMRITAYPNVGMFAYSTNTTILRINPIPTSVDSTYLGAQIWGWTGWVNLTYWDLLHDSGVHYADIQADWEGNETTYNYLGDGIYEVFINTSLVTPGIYPVSVNFLKENHEGGTGVFTLTVLEVPTSIEAYTSTFNQIDGSPLNLEVPYGDVLPIILLYNDTWYCHGIPGATEMTAVIIGPSIPDKENLVIEEIASGNYSLLFDSRNWIVSTAPYRVIVSFSLSNWSRATISIDVTIINVPTDIEVEGGTSIAMNYGQLYTVWVFYYDSWEGHTGQGIPDGIINATSTNNYYVQVSLNQSDPSRPGWYEVILVSQRVPGSAIISIEITKANHERAFVSIVVAVEPSDLDILIEQAVIYGMPIGLILLIGAVLWTRLFSVPKLLRHIRKMVKSADKGKIPKPPEVTKSRQQIIAELFNEITAELGITRTAEQMPQVSIPMEVPEIDGLLVQLSILTRLTPDELEDFKLDLTKMKLSEQVNFVKEVINQEAIKRARSERKTMEMVLEETAAQARSVLAGEEPVSAAAPETPEETVEPVEPVETEIVVPEPVEAEEDILIDVLSEDEIEEIRKKLVKAGVGKNELKTIIDQVRELPRDLVDELLKSVLGGGEE